MQLLKHVGTSSAGETTLSLLTPVAPDPHLSIAPAFCLTIQPRASEAHFDENKRRDVDFRPFRSAQISSNPIWQVRLAWMAETPAEAQGDSLRQAVQQELADKLQSHQDQIAAIAGQHYGGRRGSHTSAATALGSIDSGLASESSGGRHEVAPLPAQAGLSTYTTAPTATSAAPSQAIDLDNHMAEEQDLEPDVCNLHLGTLLFSAHPYDDLVLIAACYVGD